MRGWLYIAGSLSLIACAGSGVELQGPQTRVPNSGAVPSAKTHPVRRVASALTPPTVVVTPAEALVKRYRFGKVRRHGSAFSPGRMSLVLVLDDDTVVTVEYTPPGGIPLPVRVGERVQARYYPGAATPDQPFDERPIEDHSRRAVQLVAVKRRLEPDFGYGGLAGWALVLRDESGRLLGAVYSGVNVPLQDVGLPPTRLRAGIELTPGDPATYTEVRRLPSRCLARLVHRPLRAVPTARRGDDDAAVEVAPGTYQQLRLEGRDYRLVAMDASEMVDSACLGATPGHFSFALVIEGRPDRSPSPAPEANETSAAPSSPGPPPAAPR